MKQFRQTNKIFTTALLLAIGFTATAQSLDFNQLQANPEQYVNQSVELTQRVIGPDFTGNRITLHIRDESSVADTAFDIVIPKDNPLYQQMAVTTPVKNNDMVHVKGSFRAYSSGRRYYMIPDSIEVVEANSVSGAGSSSGGMGWQLVGGLLGFGIISLLFASRKNGGKKSQPTGAVSAKDPLKKNS